MLRDAAFGPHSAHRLPRPTPAPGSHSHVPLPLHRAHSETNLIGPGVDLSDVSERRSVGRSDGPSVGYEGSI